MAALVLGVAARVQYGRGMPLWFDETFTGTIATQPTPSALVRWCLTELTGPFFYGTMWVWVKAVGAGTAAMRLPSVLASIAAPLLLAAWGHPDRRLRLLWASVALLWLPIIALTNDARPYPLLFLLGCVQATVFLRLMRAPGTRLALAWACITAMMVLTHYSALAVGGAQGTIYLLAHRHRAFATWPAIAPFLPTAAWMAYHLPYLVGTTMSGGGHMPNSPIGILADVPAGLFGTGAIGIVVLGAIAATALAPRIRARLGSIATTPEAMLAASGVAACAGTIGFGMVHVGYAPRYLTPSIPPLLFGVAWWLRGVARADARPAMLVLGVMLSSAGAILWSVSTDRRIDARHRFGFEVASRWLMERAPRRLVFLLTDPIGEASPERNISDIAGFAFRRDGRPVRVTVVRLESGVDTSTLARTAAENDRDTAILWIANDRHAPAPSVPRIADDRRWDCREFGGGHALVHACRRADLSPPARPAPSAHAR